jgi:hypothetical protein
MTPKTEIDKVAKTMQSLEPSKQFQGLCQSFVAMESTSDKMLETMRKMARAAMTRDDTAENPSETVAAFQRRTGGRPGNQSRGGGQNKGVCMAFVKGNCRRGDACRFVHDKSKVGMCACFAAFNECKFGNKCKFPHAPVTTNDNSDNNGATIGGINLMWETAGPHAHHNVNSITSEINLDPCSQTPQVSAMKKKHEAGDDSDVHGLCSVQGVGRVMRGQKWNMDSGAMVHVCNNENSMFAIEKVIGNQSLMCADGRTKHRVHEKGKIRLQNGIVLSDVFHCPSWKTENHVSMCKMIMENYEFHMELVNGVPTMSIMKNGEQIENVQAKGQAWHVCNATLVTDSKIKKSKMKHQDGRLHAAEMHHNTREKLMGLHCKFGHPSNAKLLEILDANDNHGVTMNERKLILNLPTCKDCVVTDLTRKTGARTVQHHRLCPKDRTVLCSDLSGRKCTSVRGFRHCCVFVAHKHDGSKIVTKHLWGKLLKRKSDANTAVSEILAHT